MSFRFYPTIRYAICVLIAFAALAVAASYMSDVFDAMRNPYRLRIPVAGLIDGVTMGSKFRAGGIEIFRTLLRVAPAFLALAVSPSAWHARRAEEKKKI